MELAEAIPAKDANKMAAADSAAHDWYRFVLSFPPHLVRQYLERFDAGTGSGKRVMDPFCGTGTTVVECKKLGIEGIGVEINPIAHFAGQVKTDWSPDPDALLAHAALVAEDTLSRFRENGVSDSPARHAWSDAVPSVTAPRVLAPEQAALLLTDSISSLPLHKTLTLLDMLEQHYDERFSRHEKLAVAKILPFSVSNLRFGPEVGLGKIKLDAAVVSAWCAEVHAMANDLRTLAPRRDTPSTVHLADSRRLLNVVEPSSIDVVITSPPYPNEKDYTRTTRLESVVLGFIRSQEELRALKRGLIRSNTRGVYKTDDDDLWVNRYPKIQSIAEEIEAKRIAMGKTSGFEKLYARVTKLYFGGMAKHLVDLRKVLRPGALLAYVVGDQASYLRVMIRTGELLAEIAQSVGYEVVSIDLFRTRMATATKEQLREEVVVLRWPGTSPGNSSE